MKLGKYIRNYLSANSVKEPVPVTISSIEIETLGQGADAEDQPVIYFKELEQGLVANKTVLKFLEAKAGSDESEKWVGQQLTLYHEPNVYYQGNRVGGLRLRDRD